ncbi:hypothetical protein [Salinibacter ruber]|uniref:hypothetical protein n=1 Tax=Salinibacter ruber TaxID=146919 RepID=UPI002167FE64|nr:hypothetical protein [Salinibacter ruber]MCS4149265.1 hypothetical protein [Salinibacter ruber]
MIPEFTAIGAGIGLIIWGSRRVINGEDFDDEEIVSGVPTFLRDSIREVEVTQTGSIRFHIRANAPDIAERKIKRNVETEEDRGLEVDRDGDA